MHAVLRILPCEITFSKAQVMNGIQEIGLTNAIPATDAGDAFRKFNLPVEIIFEL